MKYFSHNPIFIISTCVLVFFMVLVATPQLRARSLYQKTSLLEENSHYLFATPQKYAVAEESPLLIEETIQAGAVSFRTPWNLAGVLVDENMRFYRFEDEAIHIASVDAQDMPSLKDALTESLSPNSLHVLLSRHPEALSSDYHASIHVLSRVPGDLEMTAPKQELLLATTLLGIKKTLVKQQAPSQIHTYETPHVYVILYGSVDDPSGVAATIYAKDTGAPIATLLFDGATQADIDAVMYSLKII